MDIMLLDVIMLGRIGEDSVCLWKVAAKHTFKPVHWIGETQIGQQEWKAYTVNHKKRDILFLTITLANLNRFFL